MNDLISRQAAIEAVSESLRNIFEEHDDVARKIINKVPSAEPVQKRGRWERHNTYRGDDTSGYIDPDWRCSACGKQANVNEWFMYDLTDFCPNCGADMREDNERPDLQTIVKKTHV